MDSTNDPATIAKDIRDLAKDQIDELEAQGWPDDESKSRIAKLRLILDTDDDTLYNASTKQLQDHGLRIEGADEQEEEHGSTMKMEEDETEAPNPRDVPEQEPSDSGDEEALIELLNERNTQPFTTVAWIPPKNGPRYINQYGGKGAHIYRVQRKCSPDFTPLPENEASPRRRIGDNISINLDQYPYGKEPKIWGIAFKPSPKMGENGLGSAEQINPANVINRVGKKTQLPTVYVLVGWRLNNDPDILTPRWEVKSSLMKILGEDINSQLFRAASTADERYRNKDNREFTPALLPDRLETDTGNSRRRSQSPSAENRANTSRRTEMPYIGNPAFGNDYSLKPPIFELPTILPTVHQLQDHEKLYLFQLLQKSLVTSTDAFNPYTTSNPLAPAKTISVM